MDQGIKETYICLGTDSIMCWRDNRTAETEYTSGRSIWCLALYRTFNIRDKILASTVNRVRGYSDLVLDSCIPHGLIPGFGLLWEPWQSRRRSMMNLCKVMEFSAVFQTV
jgi:hypothetical protein